MGMKKPFDVDYQRVLFVVFCFAESEGFEPPKQNLNLQTVTKALILIGLKSVTDAKINKKLYFHVKTWTYGKIFYLWRTNKVSNR